MFTRKKFVPTALVMLALAVPATSRAQGSHTSKSVPCAFHAHRVTKVTPYRAQLFVGRGTVLRGANLFVPAERGLTAEWLERELLTHLAAMSSKDMRDCPLDVAKIHVNVVSGGAGFWVRLTAPDATTAREVLRRAELLLG
jgi:hypothetical protein